MSSFAKKIKQFYSKGLWTISMVQNALAKGKINQDECDAILGE